MVSKIFFCSEFPVTPEKWWRKEEKKRQLEAFCFSSKRNILEHTFHLKRYTQSIKQLSHKRWRDFPIKDDLNVEVFKTGQQFTLAHNIASGHKPCCAKALRKLVSVSYSEEIFSSSS